VTPLDFGASEQKARAAIPALRTNYSSGTIADHASVAGKAVSAVRMKIFPTPDSMAKKLRQLHDWIGRLVLLIHVLIRS